MKSISAFRLFLLTNFSKPACDRELYKLVRSLKAQSIVEVGVSSPVRTENLLRVAQKVSVSDTIRYTGIDLFEGREKGQDKLTLKNMHKCVQALGIKAQLVPGTAEMAIPRIANSHLRTDLIIISGNYSAEELESCWSFFPRMLHAQSIVMHQSTPNGKFESLTRLDVEKRANGTSQKAQKASAAA